MPYIICLKKAENGSVEPTKGLAERAYHPEEISDDPRLSVDTEYYIAQQVRSCSTTAGALLFSIINSGFQGIQDRSPRSICPWF